MSENLLSKNVKLIQFTPQGAFVTQLYVAALLGVILAMVILSDVNAAYLVLSDYATDPV